MQKNNKISVGDKMVLSEYGENLAETLRPPSLLKRGYCKIFEIKECELSASNCQDYKTCPNHKAIRFDDYEMLYCINLFEKKPFLTPPRKYDREQRLREKIKKSIDKIGEDPDYKVYIDPYL
jgi:hypothetical protein